MPSFCLHQSSLAHLVWNGKRLPADQWAEVGEARAVLEQAQRLYQEQRQTFEAARQDGYVQGLQEGVAQGRAQGFEEALSRLNMASDLAQALAGQLGQMVAQALEALLAQEVTALRKAQIARALQVALDGQSVRLHVAPETVRQVESLLSECLGSSAIQRVQVVGHASLVDNDMLVETGSAMQDGRLSVQLSLWQKAVHEALRREVSQSLAVDPPPNGFAGRAAARCADGSEAEAFAPLRLQRETLLDAFTRRHDL